MSSPPQIPSAGYPSSEGAPLPSSMPPTTPSGGSFGNSIADIPSTIDLNAGQPEAEASRAQNMTQETMAEIHKQRRGDQEGIPKVVDAIGEKMRTLFEDFLTTYSSENEERVYLAQIHDLRLSGGNTIFVNYQHIVEYAAKHEETFSTLICDMYYRVLGHLQRGLKNVIRRYEPALLNTNLSGAGLEESQHSQSQAETARTGHSSAGSTTSHGGESDKTFLVGIYGLPLVNKLRDLHTNHIGALSAISGTITRTSEVRPELYKATFTCDACRAVVSGVEQLYVYTEPYMCPNVTCQNRTSWTLVVPKSQFVDWQKVRVQESAGDIPTGSMPRTMDVIIRGDIVDRVKPGDKATFTGSLTVIPDVAQYRLPGLRPMAVRDSRGHNRGEGMDGGVRGLKSLGVRELTYKLCFVACMVYETGTKLVTHNAAPVKPMESLNDEDNQSQQEFLASLNPEDMAELRSILESKNVYKDLVESIAPAVHGHIAIKKGILLQLLGGVHKSTVEGIQLRGDINVCIVGDPSTSKSQFLKYVTNIVPRSVYTSGKASSAAGLTAAVVKDEESGEFTIEAGALMLADNGICAIDEFDKMDVRDQVAIHEAMEQQTISIAKAGIQATLNARTSILAAANPIGGRYDRRKPLRSNIYMSAPIMSRFDLFFVVLDEVSEDSDTRLASHIVDVHMGNDSALDSPLTTAQLQRYIQYARTFKPKLTKGARTALVDLYKRLRSEDAPALGQRSYRITVRQLESLIRLGEAIARAHCVDEVTEDFVREAFSLLKQSTISVDSNDVDIDNAIEDSFSSQATNARRRDLFTSATDSSGQATNEALPNTVKTVVSREKYNGVVAFILEALGASSDNEPKTGSELQRWYLQSMVDQLTDEGQYEFEKDLFRKVIKRMARQNLLLELRGENDRMEDMGGAFEEIMYVVHPNSSAVPDN